MFIPWRMRRSALVTAAGVCDLRHFNHPPHDGPEIAPAKAPTPLRYPRIRVDLHGPEPNPESSADTTGADVAMAADSSTAGAPLEADTVMAFMAEKERQVSQARLDRNAALPLPTHPDDMVPLFRRIRRSEKMIHVVADPDYPTFERKDQFVQLPPPSMHPWVKDTPIGPHILHGDGQLGIAGTGEVGFDNKHVTEALPRDWRGVQYRSVLRQRLPQRNGRVLQEAVVRNSFTRTGRGLFATRDIAAGETLMIVQSTAQNVGVKGEIERLVEMSASILLNAHDGDEAALSFLHNWVLTGQPSSLLEHWPSYATQQVLERIGGSETLRALELHEIHIARLAAVIDMNSFLVESFHAERKGMAYFPEAGFLNHSCLPNATYDVIPYHTFHKTDYYVEEAIDRVKQKRVSESEADPTHCTDSTPPATSLPQVMQSSGLHPLNDAVEEYPDLTENNAPVYLFCCRATTDIPAGTEILISYVPPEWSFDNRQYVLHDRYRFWCKCPKCAPTLDAKYARVPRLVVVMLFVSVVLQLLVIHKRGVEESAVRNEERSTSTGDSRDRPARRRGLFELAEEDRLKELYALDRAALPAPLVNDPWARPPR